MQHTDTTSQCSFIQVMLLVIAITYININSQMTVTEIKKYTEEEQNHLERASDSVQHIDTTSPSTSSEAS